MKDIYKIIFQMLPEQKRKISQETRTISGSH